jgi:hypothetical protein
MTNGELLVNAEGGGNLMSRGLAAKYWGIS